MLAWWFLLICCSSMASACQYRVQGVEVGLRQTTFLVGVTTSFTVSVVLWNIEIPHEFQGIVREGRTGAIPALSSYKGVQL